MKIIVNKDKGLMLFTNEEIKTIKKKKAISFDAVTLKHLANTFAHIAATLQLHVPENLKKVLTEPGQHLKLK